MRIAFSIVCVLAGVAVFAAPAWGSPGTLDRSFDGDGKVLTNFATASSEETFAVALQRNGRIVVAGRARVGGRWQLAIARYRESGNLDPTFDGDGKVLTDVSATADEEARALAVQPDGKIVV
ncbi:MAG: delta-60 repeat domain-containing protein, partial [Thermoleophilia bacterium]|nr:delta-60 repeat domain-containing protein [Thermoleophilia bacterium]